MTPRDRAENVAGKIGEAGLVACRTREERGDCRYFNDEAEVARIPEAID